MVSFITGFKNSMKGVGYFIGAASLMVHYYFALGIMMVLILAAMPWAIIGLSSQLGRYGCHSCCQLSNAALPASTTTGLCGNTWGRMLRPRLLFQPTRQHPWPLLAPHVASVKASSMHAWCS